MAKKVKIKCTQCNGKGTKTYPGKKHKDKCSYCAGVGRIEVWI